MCRRCGYNTPLIKDALLRANTVIFVILKSHCKRVCFETKKQSKPTTNLLASYTAEPALKSGAVVS